MSLVMRFFTPSVVMLAIVSGLSAAPTNIDLETTLRLAGANNLQIKIAREKLSEARERESVARNKRLPWISVGSALRQHQDQIQTVDGKLINADKRSLSAGVGLNLMWEPSEVYYQNLVAKQNTRAEDAAMAIERAGVIYQSTVAYGELLRASAIVEVEENSLQLVNRHYAQVKASAEAGLVFAGDVHRVAAQQARTQVNVRQAQEAVVVASARLASLLRLDPSVQLEPAKENLVPLDLIDRKLELGGLVTQALAQRQELTQFDARVEATKQELDGARYGPLVPTIGAQINYGGLGGGAGLGDPTRDFASSSDCALTVAWRVGPGGLFDRSRIRLNESRLRRSKLEMDAMQDQIRREVVEQHARVASLADQLSLLSSICESAEKTVELSRQRRESGVGLVLEDITAEQELTRARSDYITCITRYNQAQQALVWALGSPVTGLESGDWVLLRSKGLSNPK
jgi:outer membrane protein TolC